MNLFVRKDIVGTIAKHEWDLRISHNVSMLFALFCYVMKENVLAPIKSTLTYSAVRGGGVSG